MQIVAIDLQRVFADSAAGKMKRAAQYEHVFGTLPADFADGHELAIEIQSAMLSGDGRSMNICIVPLPAEWLRTRSAR